MAIRFLLLILSVLLIYLASKLYSFISNPDHSLKQQTTSIEKNTQKQQPLQSIKQPIITPTHLGEPTNLTPTAPVNSIVSCPEKSESDAEKELKDRQLNSVLDALYNSPYSNEQLFAHMFGKASDLAISNHQKLLFLFNYLSDNPADKLAVHQLLITCNQLPYDKQCTDDLTPFIIAADESNGLLWLELAALAQKQEAENRFRKYLSTASNKVMFSDYHFSYLNYFEQHLVGRFPYNLSERVTTSLGFIAALPISFGPTIAYCKDLKPSNETNYQLCRQLFENMYQYSDSILITAMGANLTKHFYAQEFNEQASQQIELDALKAYEQTYNADWLQASTLMFYDEALLSSWLTTGLALGERAATQHLVSEAKLKSRNPDYNPCPVESY